jgi:geranylgeranyl reductase family protein
MAQFSGETNLSGDSGISGDFDILVVGGGPAGSLSAILLGREHEVLLVEEHQIPGFPVQCAGLVSEECFRSYRHYCRIQKAVENVISGAFFMAPSGEYLEMRGRAYVIERKLLDSMLFAKASEFVEVAVKTRVRFKGRKALVSGREINAKTIIGADGIHSAVSRHFGFDRPGIFSAIQTEVKFEPLDENFVELYFGKNYSDGFFAYSIPLGDTAKVGVISRTRPEYYLKNLLKGHPSVSKRVKGGLIELNAGGIPDKLIEFVKGDVALIGDAAGMVKPYTGGGLYYLLIAAEKLSESYPSLRKYKERYERELGREYSYGLKIRELYSMLDDADYDELVKIFKNFEFKGLDMDRPSTILNIFRPFFSLIRRPKIAIKILTVFFS